MSDNKPHQECLGCCHIFTGDDISEDGYCDSCQYEYEAKQDAKTDNDGL